MITKSHRLSKCNICIWHYWLQFQLFCKTTDIDTIRGFKLEYCHAPNIWNYYTAREGMYGFISCLTASSSNHCNFEDDFGTCLFDQDPSSEILWSFNTVTNVTFLILQYLSFDINLELAIKRFSNPLIFHSKRKKLWGFTVLTYRLL